MKREPSCATIRVENGRAICPRCGARLPGIFHTGCRVEGLTLRCKMCRSDIEIQVNNSDQRPRASGVR